MGKKNDNSMIISNNVVSYSKYILHDLKLVEVQRYKGWSNANISKV